MISNRTYHRIRPDSARHSDDVKKRSCEVGTFRVARVCHVIRGWPHGFQQGYRSPRGRRRALNDANKPPSLCHGGRTLSLSSSYRMYDRGTNTRGRHEKTRKTKKNKKPRRGHDKMLGNGARSGRVRDLLSFGCIYATLLVNTWCKKKKASHRLAFTAQRPEPWWCGRRLSPNTTLSRTRFFSATTCVEKTRFYVLNAKCAYNLGAAG